MSNREKSLRKKHEKLEAEIAAEANRVKPDDMRISTLKKKKLLVKEDIEAEVRRSVPVSSVNEEGVSEEIQSAEVLQFPEARTASFSEQPREGVGSSVHEAVTS